MMGLPFYDFVVADHGEEGVILLLHMNSLGDAGLARGGRAALGPDLLDGDLEGDGLSGECGLRFDVCGNIFFGIGDMGEVVWGRRLAKLSG